RDAAALAEERRLLEDTLADAERRLGPEAEIVASVLLQLCMDRDPTGKATAVARCLRAKRIQEAMGRPTAERARTLATLSQHALASGAIADAEAYARSAVD